MAGPLTNSKDLKDVACTGGDDSSLWEKKKDSECTGDDDSRLGEKKKDIDCTVGNDSGLGEDAFPSEDIVAAIGPKLMFRCQNRYFSIVFNF